MNIIKSVATVVVSALVMGGDLIVWDGGYLLHRKNQHATIGRLLLLAIFSYFTYLSTDS